MSSNDNNASSSRHVPPYMLGNLNNGVVEYNDAAPVVQQQPQVVQQQQPPPFQPVLIQQLPPNADPLPMQQLLQRARSPNTFGIVQPLPQSAPPVVQHAPSLTVQNTAPPVAQRNQFFDPVDDNLPSTSCGENNVDDVTQALQEADISGRHQARPRSSTPNTRRNVSNDPPPLSPIRQERPRAPIPDYVRFPRLGQQPQPRQPLFSSSGGGQNVAAGPINHGISDDVFAQRRDYSLTPQEFCQTRPRLTDEQLDRRPGQSRINAAGQVPPGTKSSSYVPDGKQPPPIPPQRSQGPIYHGVPRFRSSITLIRFNDNIFNVVWDDFEKRSYEYNSLQAVLGTCLATEDVTIQMSMTTSSMTNVQLGHVHHLWRQFLDENRSIHLVGIFNHNLVLQILAGLGASTNVLDMSHFEFLNRSGRLRSFIFHAPLLRRFLFDSRLTDNANLLTSMKVLQSCYVHQANLRSLLIACDDIPKVFHMRLLINNYVMPITHADSDVTFICDVVFDHGLATMMNELGMRRYADTDYHLPGNQYDTRSYVTFAGPMEGRHFTFCFLRPRE